MKAVRIRDAFLRAVAEKLEDRIVRTQALAKKAGRAGASSAARHALLAAVDELASFARELRILAEPERPILEVENHGAWLGRRGAVGRFERGTARGEGYGVGVWLTRRIATAHGGTLRFAHRPGKTTAIVVLPVTRVRGEVSLVARFTPRRPAPRGSPR